MAEPAEKTNPPETLPSPSSAHGGLTADGRLRSGRLAGLSMPVAMWVVAWPVLVDSLLGSLVGLTDTVLAAGLSEAAADAIGSASYILWFIGLVFVALDVGVTAVVSRSVGAGKLDEANAAVGQTLLMAAGLGAIMGGVVMALRPALAGVLGLSPEAADDFQRYMFFVCLDAPVMAVLYAGIACLRGAGDSISAMRAMVVVNIVNIVASWSLAGVDLTTTRVVDGQVARHVILENPLGIDMGVAGIGLGTLIAHATGVLLILITLARGTSSIRLAWRWLVPHAANMWRVARIGLPNFFETLGMWAGNFLVLLVVARLGAGMVGSHMVAIRIEAFSFQLGFAVAIAATTLAGQYLGAGSPALARRAILACAGVAAMLMGAMGALFVLLPKPIVGLVSGQPAHLESAPAALWVTGLVQIPFAIAIVLRQAMRGCGDVKVVMWITWITTYAVRLPLVVVFSGVTIPLPAWLGGGEIPSLLGLEPSLLGVWIGLSLEIVVRAVAFVWRFVDGGWARQRV